MSIFILIYDSFLDLSSRNSIAATKLLLASSIPEYATGSGTNVNIGQVPFMKI